MKRQYTIYNICVLLALLFLGGGWNDAWGQETTVKIESITASSTASESWWNDYDVDYLIDGRINTMWQSANNDGNPYLILDLGSVQDVDVINIDFDDRASNVAVTYSESNNNGQGTNAGSFNTSTYGSTEIEFDETISARYIRLAFTRMNNNAVSIAEISLQARVELKYTIVPQTDKGYTFPQKDIPTLVDTVYVGNGEERTLITGNYEYYWYFRWYRKNAEGAEQPTNIDNLKPVAYNGITYLKNTSNVPSYFWFPSVGDFPNGSVYTRQKEHRYAAQIEYTGTGQEDSVFCDVSFNVDGLGVNVEGNDFIEPTIGKRYKFIIKPASEMHERLDDLKAGDVMETIDMTVPYGARNVNLLMDMEPESYYWDGNQGKSFAYKIDNVGFQYTKTADEANSDAVSNPMPSRRFITVDMSNGITTKTTVDVYANTTGNREDTNSPFIITRFILTPQEGAGFESEDDIPDNEERNPENHPDKYQQIGVVDFDFNERIPRYGRNGLGKNNNVRLTPIDPSLTSYSFADMTLSWINHGYMPEDAYGLYRSANVEGISGDNDYPSTDVFDYDYDNSWSSFPAIKKTYGWYQQDRVLFDRTFYNTEPDSCGYFYYVNASKEAGRIVTVPIDGTLCANTELIITAWLADMTNEPTLPNISLRLCGVNPETGQSEPLHYFSSGEMQGQGKVKWAQLFYKISVSGKIATYEDFSVEIYNNTENSRGADYVIDDIRIYKSLPNIEVYRENACDAATLIVSTDYETILRNMGWTEGQDVITEDEYNGITTSTPDDKLREILDKRKYRYGLMGDNPESPQHLNSVVGNVYFAFLSFDDKNNNGKIDADEESSVVWQSVNNAIVEENPELDLEKVAKTIRIAVPTDIPSRNEEPKFEFFTTNRDKAIKNGQIMNYRAIQDYNHDFTHWQKIEGENKHPGIISGDNINPLDESGNDNPNFDEANYNKAIRTLYARLGIPRLRCPWYYTEWTGQNRISKLYLGIIDVDNTDLKYQDEPLPDGGKASGEYWVVTFSAEQVVIGGETSVTDFDECTLMSPFTVQPATTITVETMTDATTALCQGAVRKITPTLSVYDPDTNEPVRNFNSYIFDWYLGPEEEFKALVFGSNNETLDVVLQAYRNRDNRNPDRKEINPATFYTWMSSNYGDNAAETIQNLFDNNKLLTGTIGGETLIIQITSEDYIAMPYVWDEQENNYVYCTDWTRVHFDITGNDIPDFYVGLRLAERPVALRLGLRHIEDGQQLTIPVSKALQMAEGVHHFGLAEAQSGDREANPVYVVINGVYTQIGQLTELNVPRPEEDANGAVTDATLKIQWYKEALDNLHEGEQYILRIPFVQVDSKGKVMDSECDGWAYFPVKVVPEYLTWKGTSTDSWYDESKWNQSTKGELYFEGWNDNPDKDANGPDEDLTKAFSPLYFTKITIPEGKELALKELLTTTIGNYQFLNGWASDKSDTIRYEMAVADENGNILPYYINKVDQIYFKPNASLYRQDYLTYKKAWVDFEMKANTPYWMSAPLQDVYAGDMYAPSSNGRQETEVFNKDITYSGEYEGGTTNSRWKPAFYQKAWDKAISYITEEGYTHGTSTPVNVAAVKSNWSIEYNDVWVPYSLGKGFYSRVEEVNNIVGEGGTAVAQVRLPKADTKYSYETKALNNPKGKEIKRTNNGQMADGQEITITLSDSDDNSEMVDGDGEHFLLGNPYMGYLNMDAFFEENKDVLEEDKFWTLDREAGSIIVGTPDVKDWGNAKTAGYVAPMTAFFVELKDGLTEDANKTISFKTSMIAQKPADGTDNVYTKSYSATNPTLTITAERGETKSVAKLVTSDKADNGYEASEDAVVLLDSELDAPMVYTVSGSRAAQVNAMKEISNVGLGVYNENGDEATVTISGLSRMASPLYLYDAQTRKSVELEGDSYTMQITGDSHGRYYLRNSAMADELENTISIYSAQRGQVIVSALQPVKEIKVFNVSGALVRQFSVNTTQYTFPIQSGLYIIYASDGEQEQTEKVIVR